MVIINTVDCKRAAILYLAVSPNNLLQSTKQPQKGLLIEQCRPKEYKVIINPLSIVKSVNDENKGTETQPGISPKKFKNIAIGTMERK